MTPTSVDDEIERLIGLYLSIERASSEMLAAARDSDWDRVARIHEACSRLIDEVRSLSGRVRLDRDEQRAKLRIIRQIVRNEAQIRQLAYPWNERWEHLVFGSVGAIVAPARRH